MIGRSDDQTMEMPASDQTQMVVGTLSRTIDRSNMIRMLDHALERTQWVLGAYPPNPYSAKWELHVLREYSRLLSETKAWSLAYGEQSDSTGIKDKARSIREFDAQRYIMHDRSNIMTGIAIYLVLPIGIYLLIRYYRRLGELQELLRENASQLRTIRNLVDNPLLEADLVQ